MAEDIGEMRAKELRFEDVIRRHLDRTMASADSMIFMHNVSKLQSLLVGIIDKKTQKKIKTYTDREIDDMKKYTNNIRIGALTPYTPTEIKERTALNVLKTLINYCNEHGWLLTKTDREEVWELEEDEAKTAPN